MIKQCALRLFHILTLLFSLIFVSCTEKLTIQGKSTQHSVISMSPAATTILVSLGISDYLIGVDSWSALNENIAKDLPSFDMMNPDVEAIMALQANTLLVSTMTQEGTGKDPFKPLSLAGTNVVYIPVSESINDIYQDIRTLGSLFSKGPEAERLIGEMKKAFEDTIRELDTVKKNYPLRVYFEISPAPYLYTFGSGVFLQELLEIAGLENIFSSEKRWIAVNAEAVVQANPDIIFTNTSFSDNPVQEILSRKGWEGVKAIQDKRVYFLTPSYTSQPSPTVILALKEIMEASYHTEP